MILLDVDSVVADLMPVWLRHYNALWNDTLTPEQITRWDLIHFVKPECGKQIYKFLSMQWLYDEVEPVQGAIEGVDYLRRKGWKIVYVSAGLELAKAKFDWLLQRALLHSEAEYVAAFDKSLIRGDFLIDDRIDNVRDFTGSGILFTQPWNQWIKTTRRLDGWKDIDLWF